MLAVDFVSDFVEVYGFIENKGCILSLSFNILYLFLDGKMLLPFGMNRPYVYVNADTFSSYGEKIILQALFKIVKVVLPDILDTVNILMPLEETTVTFTFGVRPGWILKPWLCFEVIVGCLTYIYTL